MRPVGTVSTSTSPLYSEGECLGRELTRINANTTFAYRVRFFAANCFRGFPARRASDTAGLARGEPVDRAAARSRPGRTWSAPGVDLAPADEPLAEPCRSQRAAFPACQRNPADGMRPK